MNLIFMGTPEFGAASLRAIVAEGHHVAAVVTQPDRPRDRGQKPAASPVKVVAAENSIDVLQPERLSEILTELRDRAPEAIVVVAFGKILPKTVLEIPRIGCINVHASLLPEYRGAAPIARAIMDGKQKTGVTIMRMVEALDAGPVYSQSETAIGPEDTAGTLHDRLAEEGGRLLVKTLKDLEAGSIELTPQDESKASYAAKISKEEGEIDWTRTAVVNERQVRACDPWPSAYTRHNGTLIKVWRAKAAEAEGPAGIVLDADPDRGLIVGCGQGALRIEEIQREGKKRVDAKSFLRGYSIRAGERLGAQKE